MQLNNLNRKLVKGIICRVFLILLLSSGNLSSWAFTEVKLDSAKQAVVSLYTMGQALYKKKDYEQAKKKLLTALTLSNETNTKQLTKEITELLSAIYEKEGDYQKAYSFYKLASVTQDTILTRENSRLVKEMNSKYTTYEKEKEIVLLKRNEDIQNLELAKRRTELFKQRAFSVGVFIAFLLIIVVAILIFSRYRIKKKSNDQLQLAFNLIEEKNNEIEQSNTLITDSITYAKRIQDAILPAKDDFSKLFFDDFFILYRPAHIVSGDFYWCTRQNNKTILVIADCTGHGVPGAFMSMIGNTLLNEIVNERKITDTKEIANLLDKKLIEALHEDADSDQYDGMDITICSIDKKKGEISFTGARQTMYAVNGQLEKIRGDYYSIGDTQQHDVKLFTSQTIAYKEGIALYFLTDGYCDQDGGAENKKFSPGKFERLLLEIALLPMQEQKERLKCAFENWKGELKQRDDVLVIGIKC